MSHSKFVGGVLLIIGTSIGGGMLALPIATAEAGFLNAVLFLTLCWLTMTAGALLVLEINLSLPPGSNMISMAKSTLGLPGQIIAWVTYLFLLYALLSGYISGGSDVLNGLLQKINIYLPDSVTAIIFTSIFGFVVYSGIRTVDYVNRGLMFGKLGVYFILILIISPHISPINLQDGKSSTILGSIMILITSFGFATIIPSLRDYFKSDVKQLRKLVIVGSLIPLICYIFWILVIMGSIPRTGENGLFNLLTSDHAISSLSNILDWTIQSNWINWFFNMFTSVCMLTAFLGVSLGLFDFLADGFKLKKTGIQGKYILLLTFIPPLIIVLFNPGIYLHALSYAGICCVILLLLLPCLMAWKGREYIIRNDGTILLPGGKLSLSILIAISFFLLGLVFYSGGNGAP